MEKKRLTIVAVFLLFGLYCFAAFALSPMGPPKAELLKGQYNVGVDYSYSQLCMDFDFKSGSGPMADFTKNKFKTDMVTGKIGYGITDSWEGFFRIGAARTRSAENMERHNADGLTWGLGTKVTLCEDDNVTWGGLVQANWARLDGEAKGYSGGGWSGDMDLNIMQIQLAVGPTYELTECVSVYGGPFWYYLDGEKKYREKVGTPGWREKYDLGNCTDFGCYVGVHFDISEDTFWNIEYQFTEDDSAIGTGIVWRL